MNESSLEVNLCSKPFPLAWLHPLVQLLQEGLPTRSWGAHPPETCLPDLGASMLIHSATAELFYFPNSSLKLMVFFQKVFSTGLVTWLIHSSSVPPVKSVSMMMHGWLRVLCLSSCHLGHLIHTQAYRLTPRAQAPDAHTHTAQHTARQPQHLPAASERDSSPCELREAWVGLVDVGDTQRCWEPRCGGGWIKCWESLGMGWVGSKLEAGARHGGASG